jgi:simple sugar transport system ATP-binding protein
MTLAALEMVGIRKEFGGVLALDDAMFSAGRGQVHALLGENGAGKSSLMNVACGLYAPDAGTMAIDGIVQSLSGPRDATALGIGMIHQHFKLVKNFTVTENILLSNPRGTLRTALGKIGDEIRALSERLGFAVDPMRRIDTLSIAERQRVEILKVLLAGARILILDEPTAVLTEAEAERLLTTVRGIAAAGAAVVLVTHKLRDVKTYADRVTVMRGGRTVATADPTLMSTEDLTRMTVGIDVVMPRRTANAPGHARLIVSDLVITNSAASNMVVSDQTDDRAATLAKTDSVSIEVRAGQIYGIAGVGGNGQSELVESLTGVRAPARGHIEVSLEAAATGADVTRASPRQRLAMGFAFIPADRQSHALAPQLSLAENFGIGRVHEGRYGSWARVNRRAMADEAETAVRQAEVQGVRSLFQRASLLSGGNAQKLVLAREFSRDPTIIVAHSPSRGLDAKAAAAVQQRLLDARDKGKAVLLISEDLDEVLAISDRIGVMVHGRIVAEFAAPADRQAVGRAMVNHG